MPRAQEDSWKLVDEMMLVLDKGRKPDPVNTIKQMGKKGYWYKKNALGKWEYYGKGPKAGVFKFRRKTVTNNDETKKELELLIGKLPSREYVEQEIMKKVRAEFPSGLPEQPKKVLADMGLNSFKDLASVAQGEWDDWTMVGSKLNQAFGEYQFDPKLSNEENNAWSQLSQFYGDMNRATNLSDPRFTGEVTVGAIYARKEGFQVLYRMEMDAGAVGVRRERVPTVVIPYDKMQEWAEAWLPNDKERRSFLTSMKKKDDYKKWTLGHDPEIKSALSDFQKTVGLSVEAESARGGRQVQLKASYIKKLTKVFGQLKVALDLKKFVPNDGELMKIRITGAGRTYAGFYTERDKSINIAPSKPGTIGHEVGHYLWFRGGVALEDEFMTWVRESGLKERIAKTTRHQITEEERESHINHTFNATMKHLDQVLTDHTGKDVNNEYTLSQSARDGLQVLTNMVRQNEIENMKTGGRVSEWGLNPLNRLHALETGDILSLVQNAVSKGMFQGEDTDSLHNQLLALKNNVIKLDAFSRTMMNSSLRQMLSDARAGKRDSVGEYFREKPNYWEKPTEIFARTFRNYIAMKAGREIYETTDAERVAHPKQAADALGWGFPEVDPTQEMLDYDNGALQKLLKKHLGERAIKSMMTMMMKLNKGRKADPEGMVKKMGKYWYKKVGKKWIYQGQGEKAGEFKFRRKVPSMVSKLSIGTKVEVKGEVGTITESKGEWLTVHFDDRKGFISVRAASVTKVIGNDKPKAVDKSITEADPDNRAAKVAEIAGAELKEDVVVDTGPYTFTPTDRELMRATDVPVTAKDYTGVLSSKVELVSAKDILTKPRPSFIPEINDDYFSHSLNRIEGVKIGENEYVIDVGKTGERYKLEAVLAVVNGAVLAATQDYYMKRQKAAYMQRWEEGRAKLIATIPALEQKIAEMVGQGVDAYREEHMLELAKEIEKMKKPKGVLGKRIAGKPPRMIGAKRATYSHMALIRTFHPETMKDRNKVWWAHKIYIEDLGQKLLDGAAQFEEDLGAYSKGEETSYGDKGTKDTLLESHGVKVKRQNGDEITPAEIKQLSDSLDKVYAVLGDKSNMSRNWGLKISHSGEVGMHARKAAGLFFPVFKAIGVSYAGDSALTLAHEFTHFMDFKIGGDNYFHYSSDDPTSLAGKIAKTIIKNTGPMPGYWGRSCECFARGVEAYAAYKMGNDPTTVHSEHMPSREVLIEKVFPLVEQFLSENAETLKSVYSRTRMTMGLSKSGYSRLAEHLKERGKYVEGMDMNTDIVELDLGITEEMEHTDDVAVAEQIALDHLVEDPHYYSKLAGMEMGKANDDEEVMRGIMGAQSDEIIALRRKFGIPLSEPLGHLYKGFDEDDEDDDDDDPDKEYKKEQRAEEAKDKNEKAHLLKAKQIPRLMMKAKAYPEGTVRSWKSGKYKKTAQGWVRVSGGKTDQERGAEQTKKEDTQKEAQKKRDPKETAAAADNFKGYHARMKEKYGTDKLQDKMTGAEKTKYNKLQDDVSGKEPEKKKLDGSKEMLSALNSVANTKKPVFMDDITGKKKETFNALTKEGLVTWRHMGSDEYRAELTEAGISAMDGAAALKKQASRKKEDDKIQSTMGLDDWVDGVQVSFMRDIIREIDKTQPRSKVATGTDKKKAAFLRDRKKNMRVEVEALLGTVKKLKDKELYRGTENQSWLKVQPGDEVPLGLASFTRNPKTALGFASRVKPIILIYEGPPTEGIDIQKSVDAVPEMNTLMSDSSRGTASMEAEVALRASKLQVVSIEEEYFASDVISTVVKVKVVAMQKAKKETKKEREALMEKLYRDFDTPMRGETKKELIEKLSQDFNERPFVQVKKSMPVMLLMKTKAAPMNTVRTWANGRKMKKTPQGWVPVTSGKTAQERGIEATEKKGVQKKARKKKEQTQETTKVIRAWVGGDPVTEMRDTMKLMDAGKQVTNERKKPIEDMLEAVTKLPYKNLYRGSHNPSWLNVEPGDEVDLGIASFSSSSEVASGFAESGDPDDPIVFLEYVGPPTEGIDVVKNTQETGSVLSLWEKEIILRTPKIVIKSVAKEGTNVTIQVGAAGRA